MKDKYIEWIPIFGSRIMWNRMLKDCPIFAKKMNLKFQLSKHKEEIGIFTGQYRKHHVEIDMDNQKINIDFKASKHKLKDLKLWTGKNYDRLTNKDFDFKNKKLNKYFKTRQISEKLHKSISGNSDLESLLVNFFKKYDSRVGAIQIDSDLFFAYYGRGFSHKRFSHRKSRFGKSSSSSMRFHYYIPLEFLEKVIPELIDIVEAFENIDQS